MSQYQKITLGGRTWFGRGADRSPEYEAIFPQGACGMSVLDLACNTGFYALRAAYEGASRTVAIDKNAKFVASGERIARELGLVVDFRVGNMCTADIPGHFDIVLCMNVLHYFGNIDLVDMLFARINTWARHKVAMVVLVPEGDEDSVMMKDKRGRDRLAIAVAHIAAAFPDYLMSASPSRMRPHDRKLVILEKKWTKELNWM